MHPMISIVKCPPIKPLCFKISTMIVWVIFVGTFMLPEICSYNSPCRILMWNNNNQKKGLPIDNEKSNFYKVKQNVLDHVLTIPSWFFFFHFFCKSHFGFQNV